MSKQKKIAALGGALVVAAIGGSFLLNNIATSRAEERMNSILDEYELRQTVRWNDLSASIFGTMIIKGLTIAPSIPFVDYELAIKQIEVSNFTNTDSKKKASITITDIADANNRSPLGGTDLASIGGSTDLAPFSMDLFWDFDTKSDQGSLKIAIEQPGALNSDLEVNLNRVSRLWSSEESIVSTVAEFVGAQLFGLQSDALNALTSVEILDAKGNLKDLGYVERSRALFKRYNLPITPNGGSPDSQRDKAFKKLINEDAYALCDSADQSPNAQPWETTKNCRAVIDFAAGSAKTLNIKLAPKTPVSIAQLMNTSFYRIEDTITLLNPTINN